MRLAIANCYCILVLYKFVFVRLQKDRLTLLLFELKRSLEKERRLKGTPFKGEKVSREEVSYSHLRIGVRGKLFNMLQKLKVVVSRLLLVSL